MTGPGFPKLFSPLRIGGVTPSDRIVSTGHETALADAGGIGEVNAGGLVVVADWRAAEEAVLEGLKVGCAL